MLKRFFIPTKNNKFQPILLRKTALVFYTILLLLTNTFGGLIGIPEVRANSVTAENIIALTNQQRTSAGLNALNSNASLTAAAQAKAQNMFEQQYWDHFGPNGESPWMFISQAGYKYVYAGENLAKGFKTAEGIHEAWMASPTHKKNLMSGDYKDIGIAVVEGTLLGKQTILVVQMFGNLTNQTVKASTVTPDDSKPKATIIDKGEIKSIQITSPISGDLINDTNIDIKGVTKNIPGAYTVEITDDGKYIGTVESNSSEWLYDKGSDWEEGNKSIVAEVKTENIKSETVNFTIDSTPPTLFQDTITVKRLETEFTLSFRISEQAEKISFITNDKIYSLIPNEEGYAILSIQKDQVGKKSIILLSDRANNIAEYDISEYFIESSENIVSSVNLLLWFKNIIGTTDGISLAIMLFVFILLVIQVSVYWKKRILEKNAGALFTIGAWWLIILVGVFKGFGGIIN